MQSHMSAEQYRNYCLSFFENFGCKEALNQTVLDMTPTLFNSWILELTCKYSVYYEPIRELMQLININSSPVLNCSDKRNELECLFKKYREIHLELYIQFTESIPAYKKKQQESFDYGMAQSRTKRQNIQVEIEEKEKH